MLWRQARLRLDAELIRDSTLACSGLLCRRIGGPSVFPPQPDGVMTLGQMKREWKADAGADRYRRGVYTFFWRATPFPFLTTFDAPGGQQSCTRRMRSNTPLQALTLLNDPAMVEIAKSLPGRVAREAVATGDGRAGVKYAFIVCLGREPTEAELSALMRLLEHENRLDDPVLGPSDRSPIRGWFAVSRVLFNLDEFVTRE